MNIFWGAMAIIALIVLAVIGWRATENGNYSGGLSFSRPSQGAECDRPGEVKNGYVCRW